MRNIWIIAKYTFKEALSRKVFVTFFAITSFFLFVISLFFLSSNLNIVIKMTKFGESANFNLSVLNALKYFFIAPLFGGGLFLSIFSSSSFIPNMLEKGNIEILLSKPISRGELILGKFFGVTAMVLVNIAYAVVGFYLILGIKFDVWEPNLLLSIFTITFAFSLLYSMIIFIGITTKSSLSAMMISDLIFFIFSPRLSAREQIAMLLGGEYTKPILDFFYYIVPQTSELKDITTSLVSGQPVETLMPIWVSLIFIVVFLFASIEIFKRKDY